MALFEIPELKTPSKRKNADLLKKMTKQRKDPVVALASTGNSLGDKIELAKAMLESMPRQKEMIVIREEDVLIEFIDDLIEVGIGVLDVEAGSKFPMTANQAGLVLHAPNLESAYIPNGHISYITHKPSKNQMPMDILVRELQRLVDSGFQFIGHNVSYDVKVILRNMGVSVRFFWDTYIGQRVLNENEQSNRLKDLHAKYCQEEGEEKNALKFSDLFDNMGFDIVPINVGYVYACADGFKNWDLYLWQKEQFEKEGNEDLYWSFINVEMASQPEIIAMEYRGINYDLEKSLKLGKLFQKEMAEATEEILDIVDQYKMRITRYNQEQGKEIIKTPFNAGSPTQLAALLYDVIGLQAPKGGRGTGEDILQQLDHEIVDAVLTYRGHSKMYGTFIKSIQEKVHPETGRIHTRFNQVGADTLRMSSSEPNLQNIPARKKIGKEIRQTFIATDGYVLLSSDYSAQEPRLTAHMSGDQQMIDAYNAGKDLYVVIASIAFSKPYEECLENYPNGETNPDGKERRGKAKAIVLGVVYGKGIPAIANDLDISVREAQTIYNKIMKEFPRLQAFMDESWDMAYELGYVTTVWGQRRRLPDMQLPAYEFKRVKPSKDFDPLDFESEGNMEISYEELDDMWDEFDRIDTLQFRQMLEAKNAYIAELKKDGIEVKDNQGFIARAKRQTVNARIQGSAAQQTKMAVARLGKNKRLQEIGFRLLLQVHDELIGEVPIEHAKEASVIFAKEMNSIADEYLDIPSGCDVAAYFAWDGLNVDLETL